jgi:hypothetical protein
MVVIWFYSFNIAVKESLERGVWSAKATEVPRRVAVVASSGVYVLGLRD